MNQRLDPKVRKALILAVAKEMATTSGVFNLTFENVSKKCDPPCSERTIRSYFPRKTDLYRAVIAEDPIRFAEEAMMMDDDE